MYLPPVGLLRQVVHPSISRLSATRIKVSASPSTVHRITLEYEQGIVETTPEAVPSLIIKRIAPDWPGDPQGPDREYTFYRCLFPRLEQPRPRIYYAGPEPDTSFRLVIMEDIAQAYRFPPPTHLWTWEEMCAILRAYARLHAVGKNHLPPPAERGWMYARYETRVLEQAARLPDMAADIARRGLWPAVPALSRLVEATLNDIQRLADAPVTLLHNDVYPPNLGLPPDLENEPALLLDWEMAGWGMAEMDLAYMFCQPFRSQRRIDRAAAQDYYWAQREQLEGTLATMAERQARQQHADRVLALWLIPVAHDMAQSPHPPGSGPRQYWDAMFGVLGQRLRQQCYEI